MRLIDADALMNASYTLQGGTEEYHFGFDDGYRYFQREVVGDAPTIDAVTVVRCRECIRWQGKDDGNAAPCSWDWYNKDPEWYCPRGKRREDGDGDG